MCLEEKESNSNECVYCGNLVLFVLFKNLTFEECVAANDCSINNNEGKRLFFAKKIRASLTV